MRRGQGVVRISGTPKSNSQWQTLNRDHPLESHTDIQRLNTKYKPSPQHKFEIASKYW